MSEKIKVIQFGEGGFLRGFVDWMLDQVNEETDFDGSVAVVQPIKDGLCDVLREQGHGSSSQILLITLSRVSPSIAVSMISSSSLENALSIRTAK